jgi:hypothetical protein
MSMLARATRRERRTLRGRIRGASDGPSRVVADAPEPAASEITIERAGADPAQDVAIYNCQCGLVFDAPVCTSVDCPHCGAAQAW